MPNTTRVEYIEGASGPPLWVTWWRQDGSLYTFASDPHSFLMKLADRKDLTTEVLTKSTGFLGFDSDPNLIVNWTPDSDIALLDPGTYVGEIEATHLTDGTKMKLPFTLQILNGVL